MQSMQLLARPGADIASSVTCQAVRREADGTLDPKPYLCCLQAAPAGGAGQPGRTRQTGTVRRRRRWRSRGRHCAARTPTARSAAAAGGAAAGPTAGRRAGPPGRRTGGAAGAGLPAPAAPAAPPPAGAHAVILHCCLPDNRCFCQCRGGSQSFLNLNMHEHAPRSLEEDDTPGTGADLTMQLLQQLAFAVPPTILAQSTAGCTGNICRMQVCIVARPRCTTSPAPPAIGKGGESHGTTAVQIAGLSGPTWQTTYHSSQ